MQVTNSCDEAKELASGEYADTEVEL